MGKIRCISFDGGGIRGVLQSTILARLDREYKYRTKRSLFEQTEIVAGTSIGAFLAAAIACEISISEMEDLLIRVAPKVFMKKDLWRNISDLFGMERARFKQTELKKELVGFFEDRTIGQCRKKVLITSFSLKSESSKMPPHYKPVVFHNFCRHKSSHDLKVVDACLRSSAAPAGYFPIYQGHIDGGIWSNNPTPALIAEIVRSYSESRKIGIFNFQTSGRKAIDSLKVLSLGTGLNVKCVESKFGDWGIIPWIRKGYLIDLLTGDATTGALHYYSESILGANYHRVQPILEENIDLHQYEKISNLLDIGNKFDITEAMDWLLKEWK